MHTLQKKSLASPLRVQTTMGVRKQIILIPVSPDCRYRWLSIHKCFFMIVLYFSKQNFFFLTLPMCQIHIIQFFMTFSLSFPKAAMNKTILQYGYCFISRNFLRINIYQPNASIPPLTVSQFHELHLCSLAFIIQGIECSLGSIL